MIVIQKRTDNQTQEDFKAECREDDRRERFEADRLAGIRARAIVLSNLLAAVYVQDPDDEPPIMMGMARELARAVWCEANIEP